jgi:3-phenylpropionate/cinnamic acid dioxygenase small subunit
MSGPELRQLTFDAEQFLYREADLLDERRYDEWLDLLDDSYTVFMPLVRNVASKNRDAELSQQGRDMAWIDEDKATLAKRIAQIKTGLHWAEEPVSRVSHLVTNVRVVEAADGSVTTRCRFLVYQNRVEAETNLFVGKRIDRMRVDADGTWSLLSRELHLDQSVLLAKSLSVIF